MRTSFLYYLWRSNAVKSDHRCMHRLPVSLNNFSCLGNTCLWTLWTPDIPHCRWNLYLQSIFERRQGDWKSGSGLLQTVTIFLNTWVTDISASMVWNCTKKTRFEMFDASHAKKNSIDWTNQHNLISDSFINLLIMHEERSISRVFLEKFYDDCSLYSFVPNLISNPYSEITWGSCHGYGLKGKSTPKVNQY